MTGGRLTGEFRDAFARLDALYRVAVAPGRPLELGAFDGFRRALVQQLAVEERVLMPALAAKLDPGFEPMRRELKSRHRGILALLVPTPCDDWAADLRELLDHHVAHAFAPGGLYPLLDEHLAADAELVRSQVNGLPRVKLAPFQDGPEVGALLEALLANVGVS